MTPAAQTQSRTGWLKWVLVGLALLIAVPGGCSYWLFSVLADNEAARIAVAHANLHPEVTAALGTPLKVGRFASGSIQYSGSSGEADLALPVYGPKGGGTLYVKATRESGRWTIDALTLSPDDGSSRIKIIPGGIRS